MFVESLGFLLSVVFHQNFVLIFIDIVLSSRKRETLGILKNPRCFRKGEEWENR
jgi:hypothetical protein